MSYVDIVFPVNLRPLTYKCPEGLQGRVKEGMIVSAPLRNRLTRGIVVAQNSAPPSGPAKEFAELCGDSPAVGRNLLRLLSWMSDYYLASPGSVLQQTMPKELFSKVKARTKADPVLPGRIGITDVPDDAILPIADSVAGKKYRTFLVNAPSPSHEYGLAARLLRSSARNVLVVFPEVSAADAFFRSVSGFLGERVCLIHGGVRRGLRSDAIEGIASGKYDVVVGTRAALFAPLKTVSLIIVLQEHSSSYKLEEGLRYQVRDVAVMRGFMEKATVVLSSVSPSVDSYFNALTGKYDLLSLQPTERLPRIRVVNMRYAKKVRPGISKEVFDAARSRIRAGKRIAFVINRRGYSTLLLCADCGHRETCGSCDIPLVMHKDRNVLKCHYCGRTAELPERCSRCGSVHIELLGAGTQKLQEEIEDLFGVETIRFDSDEAKKKTTIRTLLQRLSEDSAQAIVGTKMMTGKMAASREFSMAAVMNADVSLSLPDFRAAERAYQEIRAVAGLLGPAGELLVQTRLADISLFRFLRSGDYASFAKEELAARKELSYPPYAKLVNIIVTGNNGLSAGVIGTIRSSRRDVEVLGPTYSKDKKGKAQFSVLLKSPGRKPLNEAAKAVLEKYGDMKDIRIVVDVDPA